MRATLRSRLRPGALEQRAVQAHLLGGEIDASEVTAVGVGETRPMALEDTEEGKALNRRVEVVLRPPTG